MLPKIQLHAARTLVQSAAALHLCSLSYSAGTHMLESSPQRRVGQVPHCMLELSFR